MIDTRADGCALTTVVSRVGEQMGPPVELFIVDAERRCVRATPSSARTLDGFGDRLKAYRHVARPVQHHSSGQLSLPSCMQIASCATYATSGMKLTRGIMRPFLAVRVSRLRCEAGSKRVHACFCILSRRDDPDALETLSAPTCLLPGNRYASDHPETVSNPLCQGAAFRWVSLAASRLTVRSGRRHDGAEARSR